MVPEKGRVLKVRIGMNPNSSGHGILFGSMVFLPYSLVSAILAKVCLSPSLEEALKEYRQRSSPARVRGLVTAFWGLSWLGFSGIWTYLMSSMVGTVSPYLLGFLSAGLSLAVWYLAHRVADDPQVAALTVRAAKLSLFPLSFGVVVALTYAASRATLGDLPLFLLIAAAYGYLTPLAIILCGVAARLGGIFRSDNNVVWASAAYVVGGLLSVMLPPYPWGGYNPAGFLFPVWGWLLPAYLTIHGLVRIGREKRHENTEDTL